MFRKKTRGGKTLQSGKKVGSRSEGSRNPKRWQDLRSALAQKEARKTQAGLIQFTSRSKAQSLADARQKIAVKKRPMKPIVRSISLLDEHRKEQRQNLQQQNRSLTLSTSGNIQVTTRQEVPPDRMATMMGDSIQITAKVERSKEDMDRQANVIAGFLSITAKNEEAKRKQRENQPRKKERQNEAHRREQLARRREKETAERALYNRNSGENHLHESNLSEGRGDESLGGGIFHNRLDHSLKRSTLQAERGSVAGKEERWSSTSRITVSNLHPAVTQQDVEELFGVIGNLKSCKMLGRGCAEVVYADKQNALIAFRRYHNRKLDGQPMQCKLNTQPAASLYSPPPARLAPLAPLVPLHPAAKSKPRPFLGNVPADREHQQSNGSTLASRPVVFKVRI